MQKQTRGEDKIIDKKRQDGMRLDEKQQEKINQEQNMMQELVKDMKVRRQKEEWREDEDHNTMPAHITNRTDDYSDIMERASAIYQAALNQPYA